MESERNKLCNYKIHAVDAFKNNSKKIRRQSQYAKKGYETRQRIHSTLNGPSHRYR